MSATCPWCAHPASPGVQYSLYACTNCLNISYCPQTEAGVLLPITEGDDLRYQMPESAPERRILDRMYGSIRGLPAFPEMAQRAIAMLHDPMMMIEDVAAALANDPALTMRILHLANSAFNAAPAPVSDMTMACVRLGMKAVAKVMWAAMNDSLYPRGESDLEQRLNELRRHAIATAQSAMIVAGRSGTLKHEESLFAAALLHDIGKLVLTDAMSKIPEDDIGMLVDDPERIDRMMCRFGPLAGLHTSQYLGLSDAIQTTIYFQNDPGNAINPHQVLACVVTIADTLCQETAGEAGENAALDTALACLGMPDAMYEDIRTEVRAAMDNMVNAYDCYG
jgi:HD-like signal output (HDOD) protein